MDPIYNLDQYRITEKYRNIFSYVEHPDVEKIVDERVRKLLNLAIQTFLMQIERSPSYHMKQDDINDNLDALKDLDTEALAEEMEAISKKVAYYGNKDLFEGLSDKELREYEKEHEVNESEKKALEIVQVEERKARSRTR